MLSSLDKEVRRFQSSAMAHGTSKNLWTQIRTYLMFCLYAEVVYLPISSDNLSRYMAFLARSFKAWVSVLNYLNGVRFYHLAHGYTFPQSKDFRVLLTLRGIRKRLCAPVSQKLPITIQILTRIYQCMDMSNITHVVLWSAFLTAFFGFLRKSNLLPPTSATFDPTKHLSRKSFSYSTPGELLLHISWSKTIQFHQRQLTIPFLQIPGNPLCPVNAYQRMVALVPAPQSSPAFLVPFGTCYTTLTHHAFSTYLQYFLRRSGIDPTSYSGHSFRRGGCTFAASCNVPPHLLKIHGDWQSSSFERYMYLPLSKRRQVTQAMAKLIHGQSTTK